MRKILCFGVVLAACGVLGTVFPQTLSGKKYVTLKNTAAGEPVTARAVVAVTPDSGSPDAYKLGGLWIGSADRRNGWYFQLAQRPVAKQSARFVELLMIKNGKYHAQNELAKATVRNNSELRWESGKPYTLQLAVDGTGADGRVLDDAGNVLAEVRFELKKPDSALTGTVQARTECARMEIASCSVSDDPLPPFSSKPSAKSVRENAVGAEASATAFPCTLSGRKYVTLKKTAAGEPVTARAVVAVTPDSGSPDAYKLGGLWIGSADRRNGWYFQLAQRPVAKQSARFVELLMIKNGKYHAQNELAKATVRNNSELRWESGKPYTLQLAVDGTGADGRVLDDAGNVLAEVRFELKKPDSALTGTVQARTECARMEISSCVISNDPLPSPPPRRIFLQAAGAKYDAAKFDSVENARFSDRHGLRPRETEGELLFNFRVERDGDYQLCSNAASPSRDVAIYAMFSLDGEPMRRRVVFPAKARDIDWERLMRLSLKAGTHTLRVILPSSITLDYLVLEPMAPDPAVPAAARSYNPKLTPPAGHPRLLLTPGTLPEIRRNLKHPENAPAEQKVRELAASPLEMPQKDGVVVYDRNYLLQIEARAFLYALEGDSRLGKEAVEAIREYISRVDFDNLMDVTRLVGHTIFVTSEVYDWCYPLLSEADKKLLRSDMLRLGRDTEIGWPPFRQSVINGHGNEAQLSRDFLSMAIAIYDEDPEPYRLCAWRIFEEMVPAHNYEYRSGRHTQGSCYGTYRLSWDMYLAMIFRSMTGEEIFSADFGKVPYFWIYLMLPNWELFDDADVYIEHGKPFRFGENLFPMFSFTRDPLLKNEFLRQNGLAWSVRNYPTRFLIFNRPDVKAAPEFDKLPQTRFFPEPLASMIARTGWEFGPDSRTAVVEMKSGHYNRHDHQHMDAGAFQIFYRAPLAVDIGVYGHWGGHYDFTFAKRTIPHNAMLVYDPEEKFAVPGNDGGQRFVRTMPWTIQQVIDHPEIHEAGRHVACYVGPDGDRPLFSYIKGDLASAYSPHKVQAYERSFVFSRLDRPETPALLVVYDHVTSTRPEYRKYFLLNTLTRPEFHGNTIRVENVLPGGKPGELFVTTLLPESDNVEVTTSGDGKAMEFFREKVEMPPRNRMLSCGWRTMVSPKTPAREDRFLHVMQIGEPSAAKYPVELLDSGAWLGVRAAGRIVTFAKSGKAGSAPVEFTVPAGEAHQVLLTDLLPGEYNVTRDGRPLCRVSVSKQAGTVEMAAEPGHYRVAP